MRPGTRIAVEASISAALALVLSLIVFAPLLGSLDVAWAGGDMLSTYVNSAAWGGFSYAEMTQFGFPLGMELDYFPGIDITENTFAWVVNGLAGTTFLGVNLLVIVSFPLVAALAYLVVRMTGLQGPLAIALAVAFTFVPYHWGRALGHTYLSTLYSAAVGLALVLLVSSGLFGRLMRQGSRRRRALAIAVVALMCVVVAWTGVYYVAFTLILGVFALLWRFAQRARWSELAADAVPFVATATLALIGFLPAWLTLRSDPPMSPLGERMVSESFTNAGSLVMAILPAPESSLPRMGYYNEAVLTAFADAPFGESTAITNFGSWVTALALLVFLAALAIRARRPRSSSAPRDDIGLGLIAYLTVVVVLFFVPWGLNYLFADLVTTQIRAWNRLLPFLLLLFILGAAVAVRRTRLATSWALALPIALVLLGLTAIDSVYPYRAAYAGSVAEAREATEAGRAYASAVNAAIPGKCGVLQLPHMAYPENGRTQGVNDYDHFFTAITNEGKEWSYGSVKSTDAGVWAAQLPQVPSANQVARLREAGFCAIHVDSRGFTDDELPGVVGELERRYGAPAATGFDGEWLLYSIGDPAPSTGDARALIRQPFIEVDLTTVTPRQSVLDSAWWWTRGQSAAFTFTPLDEQHPLRSLTGAVAAPPCGAVPVTLTLGTGIERQVIEVVARAKQPTPFAFTLDSPSIDEAVLTVETAGAGCPVGGGDQAAGDGERRFAQVLDLTPR